MHEVGVEGVTRRKKHVTTVRDELARPAADLVDRDFSASGPDQLWVADITYVPTFEGHVYLTVVLDAWSRKIVGWSMQDHLLTDLVVEAFDMAVARRNADGVIHHSNQGCQAVHVLRVQRSLRRGGCSAVDGLGRRCLRQRDV